MPQRRSSSIHSWSAFEQASYAEAGNLLRHYSTCRAAVLSVTLPAMFGVLGWVLVADRTTALPVYLLLAEGFLFVYAFLLQLFFSVKYERTRRLLVLLEAGHRLPVYRTLGWHARGKLTMDGIDKSLIIFGVVSHVLYYLYLARAFLF